MSGFSHYFTNLKQGWFKYKHDQNLCIFLDFTRYKQQQNKQSSFFKFIFIILSSTIFLLKDNQYFNDLNIKAITMLNRLANGKIYPNPISNLYLKCNYQTLVFTY